MDIPEDFQFTANAKVNVFAEQHAELIFGKDWKNRSDMGIFNSGDDRWVVFDRSGWVMEVATESPKSAHTYEVSCSKDDDLESPLPNIPAVALFYGSGRPFSFEHFSAGKAINPPDGTPFSVSYNKTGTVVDCFYAAEDGLLHAATKEEIAERTNAAKRGSLVKLCTADQDVVALVAAERHNLNVAKGPRPQPPLGL